MTKRKRHDDTLDNLHEWQEKQYLPGYWIGGKFPPIMLGKRPNRYGYILLVIGILSSFGFVLSLLSGSRYDAASMAFGTIFSVLTLAAGINLLRSR